MKVLVTGGAGFIGSHVCKVVAAAGHLPIVLDDLSGGHREAVKWGPFEIGDIGDGSGVQRILKKDQPQAVMHLAAHSEVMESCADPLRYYHKCCREHHIATGVDRLWASAVDLFLELRRLWSSRERFNS